ncbi:phage portal protein [Nocardia sp. NPDC060249]|uniref:phage portal protein n=1 Tax=Nocardia sp. NPDC060249 TaxID=3347082 RepID=UPI003669CF39
MPLPDYAGPWPPEPHDVAADAYNEFTAWWAGNTDDLAEIYSRSTAFAPVRPSQLMGGVRGFASRLWWGRPVLPDTNRLHVPAAADIATTSADLLFGQPPSWLFSEGDATDIEGAQTRLNELMDGADTVATFLEGAETQAALGGVYFRLHWDQAIAQKVMLSAVAPDAAIPHWRYGHLTAVTFWRVVGKDKRGTWRHLEHHEPGRIEHALYCGDDGSIGRRMPLEEMTATQWAAELVDEESSIRTGIDGMTACYVPNVRPARRWRSIPELAPLGRSDFEGLEHLFDALDEAWSSWMRDLDLGKGRLFVAQNLLEDQGPGKGATFDREREIFTAAPADDMGLNDEGSLRLVQANQFLIRVEEHAQTCEKILKQILRGAGYSAADFDDSDSTAMTATEVSARSNKSNQTRNRKILYWQSEVPELALSALALDRVVFGGPDFGIKRAPEMVFPVRVDQDPVQLSTAIANLKLAKAVSTETAVRMFHPNWSNLEVEEEVARITSETEAELKAQQTFLDPPSDFTDGDPANDDQDQDGTDPFAKAA